MKQAAPKLLLLPFAALGEEASLGVWARQLPQLLGRSLRGSLLTVSPVWRDGEAGRLVRPAAPLPASVVTGEAEAIAADWVLTGCVAQSDEGVQVDLELRSMVGAGPSQAWTLTFPLAGAGATFASLVVELAERTGSAVQALPITQFEPLWPLLCDAEVEAELVTAGAASLTQPNAAWSHLRTAARDPGAAWATEQLSARRNLLQRLAPELVAAFDADNPKAPATPSDLSTDEVLQLLGIERGAEPPSSHG